MIKYHIHSGDFSESRRCSMMPEHADPTWERMTLSGAMLREDAKRCPVCMPSSLAMTVCVDFGVMVVLAPKRKNVSW